MNKQTNVSTKLPLPDLNQSSVEHKFIALSNLIKFILLHAGSPVAQQDAGSIRPWDKYLHDLQIFAQCVVFTNDEMK